MYRNNYNINTDINCTEEHQQLYNLNKLNKLNMTNNIQDKTFKVYILRLVSNKYYVGKTSRNVDERFMEHINREGASWTKKYRPIEIMEYFETDDKFDEDKHTLKMMDKYGIENVRGGSFAGEILTNEQLSVIEQIINGSNDKCFKCGSSEHFVHNCPLKIGKIYNTNISNNNTYSQKIQLQNTNIKDLVSTSTKITNSNKRYDDIHLNDNCVKGCKNNEIKKYKCCFCDKLFETDNWRLYHENIHCEKNKLHCEKNNLYCEKNNLHCEKNYYSYKKKQPVYQSATKSKSNTKTKSNISHIKCYKCGKLGHIAAMCNKTTSHIDINSVYDQSINRNCSDNMNTQNNPFKSIENETSNITTTIATVSNYKYKNKKDQKPLINIGIKCYRCGKIGHHATECYSSTHINGYKL